MSILFAPLIVNLIGITEKKQSSENRKLQELPEFDIKHLDPFPAKFENFFNDHFPFRNTLLSYLFNVQARYFLRSPHPEKVVLGSDEWMFSNNSDLNYVIGNEDFTNGQKDTIINELKRRNDTCKKLGIDYRIIVVPSKPAVYPEYLPYYYSRSKKDPVTDLINEIKLNTGIPILYLKDFLIQKKASNKLFYKHDTHWNETGTFFGYEAAIYWLKITYNKIQPISKDYFEMKRIIKNSGNLAEQVGLEGFYIDETVGFIEKKKLAYRPRNKENYPVWSWFGYPWEYERAYQNNDSTLPGLMIIRDSYTNDLLQKLMASHFGRTTVIWDYWQHKLNYHLIKAEKPKVVIDIINELFLKNYAIYPEKYSAKIDTSGL
jgi:alginate O-acetyltransferase complex protein AlgJ